MKKIIITAVVCAAVTAGLLMIPQMVFTSIPTAKSVIVQKIEHTDTITVTGNIIKDGSTGEMDILAYVNEKDISKVQKGQSVEVTGDAFPNCIYDGTVLDISDYATTQQKGSIIKTVVEIKINIINPDDNLKVGYTANAKLLTSEEKTMTIIPYEAVNQDDIGEYVYILEENTATKRYIKTGSELSDGIEVLEGISNTDYVITIENDIDAGKTVLIDD